MSNYAEIIIDLISNAVDRPFHYRIPDHLQGMVTPGVRVDVPLGPRRYQGYVLRLLDQTPIEEKLLRDVSAVQDPEPLLTAEQLALVHWLALRYQCRKIDALRAMIPASYRTGRHPGKVEVFSASSSSEIVNETALKRAPAQRIALDVIATQGPLSRSVLAQKGIKSETLRNLEKKGLITRSLARDLASHMQVTSGTVPGPATTPHLLRGAQVGCFDAVHAALEKRKKQTILLHGITASGKTEIYLQSIAFCLEQGRSAVIMVPEIALTPQMIDHFAGRFPGRVAVVHSRLSVREKNRQWEAILSGEARVVLGARSAVFAPLEDIGLIIIDEEHETTYKQEDSPRYHARDVAFWRSRYHRAVILLGSATPSLESYYRAGQGESLLLKMKERVTPTQLPPVEIVDMRKELKDNHRLIFSRSLLVELQGVIDRDEQALLFINRRGFAGFVLCRECGYVVRCPSCDVSLTLHLDKQLMRCHYCAHEEPPPLVCPACAGTKIRYFSAGTQRVEEEMKKLYPDIPMIRMDSDTTTSREAHSHYYRRFRERKATILIGTQMIAKGFDFPDVTLVGVVAADTSLNLPDFRSPERTFQLLTQVSGRTARGTRGGKVIVQTYHPTHYSILTAAEHDYESFYAAEIENRRQLAYPPFTDIMRFIFSCPDEKKVFEAATWFTNLLAPLAGESAELLGPAPASLYRIKEQYRVHTILKGESLAPAAPAVKKLVREYHQSEYAPTVRLAVDFNPMVVL